MRFQHSISIVLAATLLSWTGAAQAKPARHTGGSSTGSAPQGFLTRVLSVPFRSAGAVVGVALGVPIHVGRSVVADSRSTSSSLENGSLAGAPGPVRSALGTAVGVPVGIVTGAVRGSVEGTGQGLTGGYKRPFSSQSVGL